MRFITINNRLMGQNSSSKENYFLCFYPTFRYQFSELKTESRSHITAEIQHGLQNFILSPRAVIQNAIGV